MKHINDFDSFLNEAKNIRVSLKMLHDIAKESPNFSKVSDIQLSTTTDKSAMPGEKYFEITSKLKSENDRHKDEFDQFDIIATEDGGILGIYVPNGNDEEINSVADFKEWTRA